MKDARRETIQRKREKATRKFRLEREIIDEMYRKQGVINIEDDDDQEIQMSLRDTLKDSMLVVNS
jgi:hypothetical protein